jgi:hypothetical protein
MSAVLHIEPPAQEAALRTAFERLRAGFEPSATRRMPCAWTACSGSTPCSRPWRRR